MSAAGRFFSSRMLLRVCGAWLLLLVMQLPLSVYAAQALQVRVWPADEYTRITLENNTRLKASYFTVKNPERLVVEVEGVDLNAELRNLVAKIKPDDPYVQQVRVGQNRPKVVRLVFDLKAEIKPQVFAVKPVGGYRHRLVLDLYPAHAHDPIAALISKGQWKRDGLPEKTVEQLPESMPQAKLSSLEPMPQAKLSPPAAETEFALPATRPGPKLQLKRMVTVMIDPGHGGEDSGALGHGGSREKDVVLLIAKRLKARIDREPNMRAVLTRNADFFVPLHVRVQKARQAQADLFISIHADAFIEPSARGASVFVLSEKGASSTAAKWLARKENAADLVGGVNIKNHGYQVASVLLDLSTTAQIKDSMKLGNAVLTEIGGINRLHKGSVEQAGFAVLKAPDIPSILVETAFISNPDEEKKLTDGGYQDKMADAILVGVKHYFKKNPPAPKGRMT